MDKDSKFTRDEDGYIAVRTVSAPYSSGTDDKDSMFTTDEDGYVAVRTINGAGSSGGDSHNKGYFATQAALEEAYPTAEAGDWAIVGATDTVWIWDEDSSAWVDSDQKGQVVSVNGKTGTVVLTATDVDAMPQYSSMPTAAVSNEGDIVQFTGTTDATYTKGYFYKCAGTTTPSSAVASQTVGSSLSDIAVVVATFETQITTSGSYIFTSDGVDWSYDGNVVDLTDYGITYTGTPVVDDEITVVYTAESTSYAWTRVDVQPAPSGLPDQTGQSGKFLTTDGTDASWGTISALQNTATGTDALTILGTPSTGMYNVNIGYESSISSFYGEAVAIGYHATSGDGAIAIGRYTEATGSASITIGNMSSARGLRSISIGLEAEATADYAIQIGGVGQVNSDANTVKIANENGNFEIMNATGNLPADRLASTTGLADGNYKLRLTMADGVPTLSWVAE